VKINGSEQTCMTVAFAGQEVMEIQAIIASVDRLQPPPRQQRSRFPSTSVSKIGTHTNSLARAAILLLPPKRLDVLDQVGESASAFASEAAALFPAQKPTRSSQTIKNTCGAASSLNHYFEQLIT
jgi:hypothetical protein